MNAHPAAARLARAVEAATGEPFASPSTQPVGGGCITKGVALKSATLKVKKGTTITIK